MLFFGKSKLEVSITKQYCFSTANIIECQISIKHLTNLDNLANNQHAILTVINMRQSLAKGQSQITLE